MIEPLIVVGAVTLSLPMIEQRGISFFIRQFMHMRTSIISFLLCLPLAAQAVVPTDLLAVYDLARHKDPQIRAAQAQKNAAHELRPQALSAVKPNVSMDGALSYQTQDVTSSSTDYNHSFASNHLTLNLTQPVYRRELFIALDQVDDQLVQADANYAAAEQDLIVRVAQAYFGILSADDDLNFAFSEKTAIAQQLDQAKQRFEVGLIAITDVHEVQSRFDQAEADRISAENALDNARENLREIIQSVPEKLANLLDEIALMPPQPESIDAWSDDAQKYNPAIQAAKLSAAIAHRNISVQRAGYHPSLDLNASMNRSRTESDFGSDTDAATISLQLTIPLFQGGKTGSKIRQARHEYDAEQEILDQQRRAIDRQVRNAYRGIQTSISRVKALLTAQNSAQSALTATQAGFSAGTRTLVDVLNSQRDLYRAKRNYAQSRYDYVLNTLSLLQAVGTLSVDDLRQVNRWLE